MFDQTLLTSGFDTEVLLSERFFAYTLLTQVEAGRFPLEVRWQQDATPASPALDLDITVHPPLDHQRLYDPDPGAVLPVPSAASFGTQLLFGHVSGADLRVRMDVAIADRASGVQLARDLMDLLLALDITSTTDDRGFERDHRLRIELVALTGPLIDLLDDAGVDIDDLTAEVAAMVDRDLPLGVTGDGTVQRVAVRKHPGGGSTPNAFGVYSNLLLLTGPEPDAFLADRGNTDLAQNFLPGGSDLAFGTAEELYARLGPDLMFRRAEEDSPGSGTYSFPLREDPSDDSSEEIGRITRITVEPRMTEPLVGVPAPDPDPGFPTPDEPTPMNELQIVVAGVYTKLPIDVNFALVLRFRPMLADGLLSWGLDAHVNVSLLFSVLGLVGLLILGAIGGMTLVLGGFVGLLVGEQIISEKQATGLIGERADGQMDTAFLDALPHRLSVASRRWDPLYDTLHQVVALLGDVQINPAGLAWHGPVVLDRAPAPVAHTVVRDERRDHDGDVTGLRYRVRDIDAFADDLVEVAPGTDRRPYVRADPVDEPELVDLTTAQIDARLEEDRLLPSIPYQAKRVHLVDHTIASLLCISRTEAREQRRAVIGDFRRDTGEAILAGQGDDLRAEVAAALEVALGREPTPDEVEEALAARVTELVDEAFAAFADDGLDAAVEDAISQILHFDLAPAEWAQLEESRVTGIEGKVIVRMRRPDGEITTYYRDQADDDPFDNLLALPRYTPPYEPAPEE